MSAIPELLTKFSQAHGASGYEDQVRALVVREFNKLVDRVNITPLGSVIGIKEANVKRGARRNEQARNAAQTPRVLVEAHMDEIGLLVTDIQDGFIRFDEIGMFDPRVLPSQNVLVHGRKILPGVIGARPPHVLTAAERTRSIPLRDLFIDVGMSDASVRELVSVGDFITLDRDVISLQNDFVAGKAFDDRCCLVALLEMLRALQNMEHAWDVYAVANVNEEDSAVYVGALTSTRAIQPDIAICLDVTHAHQPGLNDDAAPLARQGPCIARGANVHPVVFEKLRQAALRGAIPHQITVYGDDTETNAWMMQVTDAGVPTGLVEIPLRYMHTSVETIHLDDVARMAELLSTFVGALESQDALAFQGETFVRVPLTRIARRAPKRKTLPHKYKKTAPKTKPHRKIAAISRARARNTKPKRKR